jgi:selenocysteine-specific elongation factor
MSNLHRPSSRPWPALDDPVTVVVGTAGHIDHGKTTLLRALTGIDADRLPEERRRGMTIDVGYAHLTLDDETAVDFVDVPGHDRLVGNMLVGAGEIDAAMLVVAADDGPRAQTLEHLALLDALGMHPGLVVVTKIDVVEPARILTVVAEVRAMLGGAVPVIAASGVTGDGLPAVRAALADLIRGVTLTAGPPSLAIDRVFSVKGRGSVVTGSLRGGPLARGDVLRLVPGPGAARIREVQVHGAAHDRVEGGGRTALNVTGVEPASLARGAVLTADPEVVASDRLLAAFPGPATPADRSRWRLHLGTAAVDAAVGRSGRDAIDGYGIVRLGAPVAVRPGDRFLLRRSGVAPIGGTVVDALPARGTARRRQTPERVAALAAGMPGARLDLHGALVADGTVRLATDVAAVAAAAATAVVQDGPAPLVAARGAAAKALRRAVSLGQAEAATAAANVVDELVKDGRLVRDGDTVRRPGAEPDATDPAVLAAMDRLEAALDVDAPPPLGAAAQAAGCPPDGIRALERASRIVVLESDLAYAMPAYQRLAARAIAMARREPLLPAAFRDATGTSRKYVMAILEDLDRRALLRRTPDGHVPGPRAPSA